MYFDVEAQSAAVQQLFSQASKNSVNLDEEAVAIYRSSHEYSGHVL